MSKWPTERMRDMPSIYEQQVGYRLGHFSHRDWNERVYKTQLLPDRPDKGSETHTIACQTCGELLSLEVFSSNKTENHRLVKKYMATLVLGLAVLFMFLGRNVEPDPATHGYPGTLYLFYGLMVVCFPVAFAIGIMGLTDHGLRLRVVEGSKARLSLEGHRLIP